MADLAVRTRVDEEPRVVAALERMLRDQLVRQLVVELACVHPTPTLPSAEMEDRYSLPPEIDAALDRGAAPGRGAGPDGRRAADRRFPTPSAARCATACARRRAPISRRLAEVKGLSNQMIRRLERLETDLLIERHARVDDLKLLVDLITAQWKGAQRAPRQDRARARSAGAQTSSRCAAPRPSG